MIRVSIEHPDDYGYRLQPVVDLRQRFFEDGVLVGVNLKDPDLRIVHQNIAIEELARSPEKRLPTPTIVDERVDGGQIINNVSVRSCMAHPDVKFWLKRNTYRDFRLNNASFVVGRHHYRLLNEIADFHMDLPLEPCVMPITEEMASKIRLLPTVGIERFAFYREQTIDWKEKRPIDVSFAGLVDYEVRGSDFWDSKFAEAQAATDTGPESLPNLHRRAAALQLTRLRHLRVLIAQNRALQLDIYRTAMLRSSISVSPWGFGEYAYRDYESILAGCVLVKPLTDYIETFAPDIYQSGKYYISCKPDFSDLPEVIEGIMSNREPAIERARRAREDMLEANSPDRIYAYYSSLFRQALGEKFSQEVARTHVPSTAVLALDKGAMSTTRAEIARRQAADLPFGAKHSVTLTEDHSKHNSHDIRLFTDAPVPAGLYRLRFAVLKRGRSRVAVQLHREWEEVLWMGVDLDSLIAEPVQLKGNLFKPVYGPELSRIDDGWVVVTLAIHLTDFVYSGLNLNLYAGDKLDSIYYDGDGRIALDIAILDFERIDMRTI